MRSPQEAYDYLVTLKRTVKYLDVSDCNMEEGSLRCDANISIRKKGEKELGSKVEVKNMNSFKAVKDALTFEQGRQIELAEEGEKIIQETRLWNEKRNITSSMRTKEEEQDYRYFPEPDLVPFEVSPDLVEEIRRRLPELPAEKSRRFVKQYGLSDEDTEALVVEKDVAAFYEKVVAGYNDPKTVFNWVKGEVMMHMNERGTDIFGLNITPDALAGIIKMTKDGAISGLAAKEVLKAYIETGKDPQAVIKEKGLEQVSDKKELEDIIEKVIAENEKSVSDFKSGKETAISFLVGQVMKASKGKANPKLASEMLRKKLKE
jgi:aspartyl-tRNA(Asn)/glutamyl-tRNA(Gln) amidotransferase subunit B